MYIARFFLFIVLLALRVPQVSLLDGEAGARFRVCNPRPANAVAEVPAAALILDGVSLPVLSTLICNFYLRKC